MDDVGDVRGPVGDGTDSVGAGALRVGGDGLGEDTEPREHGEAAVLKLLDLERVEVLAEEVGLLALGEVERVEAAAREDGARDDVVEGVLQEASAETLGGASS